MSLLLLLRPRASGGAPAQPAGVVELRASFVTVLALRARDASSVLALQASQMSVVVVRFATADLTMAIETNIGTDPDARIFVGERKTLKYQVFEADGITPKDVTGQSLEFVVRKRDHDADPAIVRKTTGGNGITITGTFNVDPLVNTQRVEIDVDLAGLKALTYRHALWRTDGGFPTVLGRGDFAVSPATKRQV